MFSKMYSDILSEVQLQKDQNMKVLLTNFIKTVEERDLYHCLQDNAREQYARNWSIRINGCMVSDEDMLEYGHPRACMNAVYSKIIKPVLAKSCPKPESAPEDAIYGTKVLDRVPHCLDLLSTAHYIGPAKNSKTDDNVLLPPAIIVRFRSRYMRNLFLRTKRQFMPQPTVAEVTAGIKYYSAYADLTKMNHKVVTKLKADDRVQSVWTNDGKIRFSLKSNPKMVHHVSDISYSTATIISSAVASTNTSIIVERKGEKEKPPQPASPSSASPQKLPPAPAPPTFSVQRKKKQADFVAGSRRGARRGNKSTRSCTASQSCEASSDTHGSPSRLPTMQDIQKNKFNLLANTDQG